MIPQERGIWYVLFAMHSSRSELLAVVRRLQPRAVIPSCGRTDAHMIPLLRSTPAEAEKLLEHRMKHSVRRVGPNTIDPSHPRTESAALQSPLEVYLKRGGMCSLKDFSETGQGCSQAGSLPLGLTSLLGAGSESEGRQVCDTDTATSPLEYFDSAIYRSSPPEQTEIIEKNPGQSHPSILSATCRSNEQESNPAVAKRPKLSTAAVHLHCCTVSELASTAEDSHSSGAVMPCIEFKGLPASKGSAEPSSPCDAASIKRACEFRGLYHTPEKAESTQDELSHAEMDRPSTATRDRRMVCYSVQLNRMSN